MKVTGFNGSPRKDGNTTTLMSYLLQEAAKEGIETEIVQLADKTIHGCMNMLPKLLIAATPNRALTATK